MGTRLDYGNGRIKSSSSLFSQKKNTKKKNKYGLEQVFPESELERKWTSGYSWRIQRLFQRTLHLALSKWSDCKTSYGSLIEGLG